MIKDHIKRILPLKLFVLISNIKENANTALAYLYDFIIYKKHSHLIFHENEKQLEGRIIANYHVLEKGLSYSNMKYEFGKQTLYNLLELLKQYKGKYNINNEQYRTALSVIKNYIHVHEQKGYNISEIINKFNAINSSSLENIPGGVFEIKKTEILNKSQLPFKEFAFSRHTIRDFTDQEVDLKIIEEAIEIALQSPSVCNRQTCRVYVVKEKHNVIKHLKYQNGNRGFGEKINKLLIITSDLNYFEGLQERNQCFIDGGIFCMSLLYAIHFLGLGGVSLNWCTTPEVDKSYHKFSGINSSEKIILFIGVGHLPDSIKVTKSLRKKTNNVIKYF